MADHTGFKIIAAGILEEFSMNATSTSLFLEGIDAPVKISPEVGVETFMKEEPAQIGDVVVVMSDGEEDIVFSTSREALINASQRIWADEEDDEEGVSMEDIGEVKESEKDYHDPHATPDAVMAGEAFSDLVRRATGEIIDDMLKQFDKR